MANSATTKSTGTKYTTIAVTASPIIILGGVCVGLGWRYVSRAWKPHSRVPRSVSLAALHGGKLAMDRLLDYKNSRGKPTEKDGHIKELKTLLNKEQPDFKELQRILARLEMSRREDEAIKLLEDALKKAQQERKPHEAYEIEMLLTEMYIYKGDIQEASKCECLKDKNVSDARKPFYKAIISLMDQKEQDAFEHWKDFKDIQHLLHIPDIHDEEFIAFNKAVKVLKEDIDAAKATQP